MKKAKTIITLIGTSVLLFSCGNNAGNSSIKIGTQTWAEANLDVSTFRNGDAIPEIKTEGEWKKAGEERKPACCYYNNDPTNGKKYGKLYNWFAVNDSRGLAPNGWHIPSDVEWTTLIVYLGGEAVAGTKMKATSGWKDNANGTNESGFTGLPGGMSYDDGSFYGVGSFGYWWSSTESSTPINWGGCSLSYYNGGIGRSGLDKPGGFSVRCLKD